MEKFIKITFLDKEIKVEVNQLTRCEVFKAITCLLQQMNADCYSTVRKALTDAEEKCKENKENKND